MKLLEVKNIVVHYEKAEAVKGISFQVEEGTVVSLIGSNGAGKTTVLRTISGLKKSTAGEIWFNGKRIDKLPPQEIVKAGIAHCPEGRRLFPQMSVLDNLRTAAFLRNDKEEIKKDIDEVFQRFPILGKRQQQYAGTLSGGEQQMLAIARALISRPALLIMDEPSLGLAPLIVKEIGVIIRDIHKRGVTILLVEQNAQLALKLADRGYVMEVGKITLEGNNKELLSNGYVKKAYLGG
ncbi:MAG: ABC transporter ATP-binding protein [Dethiobacter sp.]|nr:ABC transporter ATP-binding protein [Dethiobacter sp.]